MSDLPPGHGLPSDDDLAVRPEMGARKRLVRRLAWREVSRAPGRSALIVAVFAISMATVMVLLWTVLPWRPNDSSQSMGAATGMLVPSSYAGSDLPAWVPTDPAQSVVIAQARVSLTTGGVTAEVTSTVVDQTNPRLAGLIQPIAAANPNSSQVALSRVFAEQIGVTVGDLITVSGHQYQVSAIVRTRGAIVQILVPPGHPLAHDAQPVEVLAFGWRPEGGQRTQMPGWEYVERGQVGNWPPFDPLWATELSIALSLLTAMASGTLATAAFAVGARQRRRTLALLGSAGASNLTLRRILVASAWLLGLIGTGIGVTLGLAVLYLYHRSIQAASTEPTESFAYPWWLLPIPVAGTLAAAGISAWLPARWVTTRGSLQAIRESDSAPDRARFPWLGLGLAGVGVGLGAVPAVIGVRVTQGAYRVDPLPVIVPAVAATVCLFFAAVVSTGWLVQWLGARHWRRLGVRISLRDAARHRGRATSSVAAMLAVATLAGVVMTALASLAGTDVRDYQPTYPTGHAAITSLNAELTPTQQRSAEQALFSSLGQPKSRWQPLVYGGTTEPVSVNQLIAQPDFGDPFACVGDAAGVEFWTGQPVTPEVADALARGVAIVFTPDVVVDGWATLQWTTADGEVIERSTPALYLPGVPGSSVPALVPATTASALGLPAPVPSWEYHYDFDRPLTTTEERTAEKQLGSSALLADVIVETGPHSLAPVPVTAAGWAFSLVLLLVALMVSMLTLVDARSDYLTLAQIGASQRTLRRVSAVQSWVTTSLGTALGLMVGWLPTWAVIKAGDDLLVAVLPWRWAVIMLLGVPAAAALLTATLARPPEAARAGEAIR